jgi:hypothetical protein
MVCIFSITSIFKIEAQEYILVGFTEDEYIPSATINGTVFYNDTTYNTYSLITSSEILTKILGSYTVIEFRKEFPSANLLSHKSVPMLNRVYRIKITQDPQQFKGDLLSLGSAEIDNVFVFSGSFTTFSGVNPNDYYSANHKDDNTHLSSTNKHLDLINAKKAWEYTRGNSKVYIGITDIGFMQHTDINSKVKASSSVTNVPTANGSFAHGLNVAGCAGAINDNANGIASIGNKISLKYYYANDYNEFLKAVADSCKVINCSWAEGLGFPIHPNPMGNPRPYDYYQKIINVCYDFGVTVIAAAGNCNTGGNCTDYFYPASYEHVISVTAVGSRHPIDTREICVIPNGTSTPINKGFEWEDMHEMVKDLPYRNTAVTCQWNTDIGGSFQKNDLVDICAPGYGILCLGNNNGLMVDWGTSLASPMVAGTAALLYSLNPNFLVDDIENILKSTAHDIYPIATNSNYLGLLGSGRLDAGAACAFVNNNDLACRPRVQNITWKANGSTISNNDYWQYNSIEFSISSVGNVDNYEWEFISGNTTIKKITNSPTATLDLISELPFNIGVYNRNDMLPLEVYVRRINKIDPNCMSAFYKESGIKYSVLAGANALNGPYPSLKNNLQCEGNTFIGEGNILGGDVKSFNTFIGSSFGTNPLNVVTSSQNFETNIDALNSIQFLTGVHIQKPLVGAFFRAFLSTDCSIPNRWKVAPGGNTPNINPPPRKLYKNKNKAPIDTKIVSSIPQIMVYPNPTSGNLRLEIKAIDNRTTINITDINGKLIKQFFNLKSLLNNTYFDLNVSTFKSGTYFIKVISKKTSLVSKFVKL